ncbi:MAG: hypothetical protein ACYDBA_09780 [Sulfuricaulis sp.]
MMKAKLIRKDSTSVSKPGQPICANERCRMIAEATLFQANELF